MKNEPLKNTKEQVITAKDIMRKYGCSKGKALTFMKNTKGLHAHYFGNTLVCERQYFDAVINDMNYCGGTVSLS